MVPEMHKKWYWFERGKVLPGSYSTPTIAKKRKPDVYHAAIFDWKLLKLWKFVQTLDTHFSEYKSKKILHVF